MPEPAVLVACRSLVRAVDGFDEACARELGIHRSDLRALNLLEGGPVALGALAAGLGLTAGSVTPLVDRLARRGLVRRVPSPTDRRSRLVELLPAAHARLVELYAPLGRGVVAAFDAWPPAELEHAAAGMTHAASVFDEHAARVGSA